MARSLVFVLSCLGFCIAASAAAENAHTTGTREHPVQTIRFSASGSAVAELGELGENIVDSPLVRQLTALVPTTQPRVTQLRRLLHRAQAADRLMFVPSIPVRLADGYQLLVTGRPSTTMLYVKRGFAVAGLTTRAEIAQYFRIFSRKADGAEYRDRLIYVPVSSDGGGGEQLFLVLPNPSFRAKPPFPEALRPYSIESIVGKEWK